MRYAQRGGYTPAEQQRRERLRLQAAERFARGEEISEIAYDLRVTEGSVRRWHRAKLKKIQYRPHLIDGCLAATGLRIEPW